MDPRCENNLNIGKKEIFWKYDVKHNEIFSIYLMNRSYNN